MSLFSPVDGKLPFAVVAVPGPETASHQLIWGHGWGQSSAALLPLAESLRPFAPSMLIDFPGFGQTPAPPDFWGTADYADRAAGWLRLLPPKPLVWIGHSFGCRVGLQIAARHPELLSGIILIAGAGLPRKRSLVHRLKIASRRNLFRAAKRLLPEGRYLDRLRQRMGSADYRAAGALRPVLSRVVGEDLTDMARTIQCPALLLYGANDTDTPPEIGERLNHLIAGSELVVLQGFGHLDVLTEGRHQVVQRIRTFLDSLPRP